MSHSGGSDSRHEKNGGLSLTSRRGIVGGLVELFIKLAHLDWGGTKPESRREAILSGAFGSFIAMIFGAVLLIFLFNDPAKFVDWLITMTFGIQIFAPVSILLLLVFVAVPIGLGWVIVDTDLTKLTLFWKGFFVPFAFIIIGMALALVGAMIKNAILGLSAGSHAIKQWLGIRAGV